MGKKVLLVSYYFNKDAEGICTARLANALTQVGMQVTVLTSKVCDIQMFAQSGINCLVIDPVPSLIQKLIGTIARKVGVDEIPYLIWEYFAKKATLAENFDLIYGRGYPLAGLSVAAALAEKMSVPLWIHFSDPMPSPWSNRRTRTLAKVNSLVRQAEKVTFTNSKAALWQQEQLSVDFSMKVFILSHIATKRGKNNSAKNTTHQTNFVYIGSFYRQRTPERLLQGFALYLQRLQSNNSAMLNFVGTNRKMITSTAISLGIANFVKVLPPSNEIGIYFDFADVLVAVDSEAPPHVFLSTKFIEYVMEDRLILLLSPSTTPSSEMVRGMHTVVQVNESTPEAIADGFFEATRFKSVIEYSERSTLRQLHSLNYIGNLFKQELEKSLSQ